MCFVALRVVCFSKTMDLAEYQGDFDAYATIKAIDS